MDRLAILGGPPVIKKPFPRYNHIGQEEINAVNRVLQTGVLSNFLARWGERFYGGKEVLAHEKMWEEKFNVKHAISMNSATSCLYAAIGAIGVGPGDEVIVSPFTMGATATAILIYNAIPVFADIEPKTFNMDPDAIEKKITSYTKAIVVPNIFGHSANYNRIKSIAKKHNLKIIEDNAQAPLAEYHGALAGTIGDIGVFSLNYHKHIQTGEGGVCLTNDDELADRLCLIRNHAEGAVESKGVTNLINMIGFNFRFGEIESAIGIEQLKKLDRLVHSRIEIADKLSSRLSDIEEIQTPFVEPGCKHVYYVFPIRYKHRMKPLHRDRIVDALKAEGLTFGGGYVQPLYLKPIFQKQIGYGDKGCPFSCSFYKGTVDYSKGLCPVAEEMFFHSLLVFPICNFEIAGENIDLFSEAFHKVFSQLDELIHREEH